jgi:4-diphosphocytidyl-2-C-methyl-D-erythritol kinase
VTALASERAYAKVNLSLLLGPAREDGRHRLVTLFDSLDLVDALDVTEAEGPGDVVRCEGVTGPNLVDEALAALRGVGWNAPPVEVRIVKRIPVAAGMGGGSADAAAMLRAAVRIAPIDERHLDALAARLGADVPAQLHPGPSLGTGAGEIVAPLPGLPPYGVLVLPAAFGLSAAEVYREADRLGLARSAEALEAMAARLRDALPITLPAELIVNDLQAAALSLAPALGEVLAVAQRSGADHVLVCGSGPTVIGLFLGPDGTARARAAAGSLEPGVGAIAAAPVGRGPALAAANIL